jgi:7,8-dihydroneopterin 2',3'-cyclic phosphate phosphodiesterase
LNPKLKQLVDQIQNPELRQKVMNFLENPTFSLDGKVYVGLSFDISPGGLSHHHTYVVNRDYVAAGVLLHDIFKPVTYAEDENGGFSAAPLADYMDHISLATSELVRRDFPLQLIHIVTAHYGSYGPIKPRTVEALVVHLADNADSHLNGQVLDAAWYLTRKATGEGLPRLNAREAFEIVRAKASEGFNGVTKSVERISHEREAQKT